MHHVGLVWLLSSQTPSAFNISEMESRKAASQYGEIPARCLRAGHPVSYPDRLFLFQWTTTAAFTYLEDLKLGVRSYFY